MDDSVCEGSNFSPVVCNSCLVLINERRLSGAILDFSDADGNL